MPTTHPSIPQPGGKQRRGYLLALALLLVAGTCALLAVTGAGLVLTRPLGLPESRAILLYGVGTGFFFTLAAAMFWKARFFSGPKSEKIEATQAQQRQVLMAITVMTTAYAGFVLVHGLTGIGPDFAILFALLALCIALTTAFGVGFARRRCRAAADDELVRHLRWRATQLGYVLAAAGLTVSYLVLLFHSGWLMLVLPLALLAATVPPAVYFLIAEGRAAADA